MCFAGQLNGFGLAADGEIGGEERFFVDLDENGIIARLRERQVADFVDEVDAMKRALGNKRTLEQRLKTRGVEAEGNPNFVLTRRTIADGEEPNHERMRHRKLAGGDIGEDSQQRVLAGARIDVNAIARDPREQLRFGLHRGESGAALTTRGKSFCLEKPAPAGLTAFAMFVSQPSTTMLDSLAGYPPWFVAICGTIVAAALIWFAAKLLKWSLYLLMTLVLIGGAAMALWLVFQ